MAGAMERLDRGLRRVRHELLVRVRGDTLLLALGAAVGLATGLLAVALIAAIRLVQQLAWGWGTELNALSTLLVPALGAFVVGLLVTYWAPETSGSGVVTTMTTLALRGGRFTARTPAAVVATTGIALGTGASGGREGPIVLGGGAVGSLLGRLFAVGEEHMRTLVAAGAAAGIGASFNAPIGGMLFALELIVREFRARSLQVIVVAAVVGSVTAREIVGPAIIYEPRQPYGLGDPRELLLYVVLGLAAVAFGLALIRGEDLAKHAFARLPMWRPFKLLVGGLGVGAVALLVPEVLGTGDRLPPVAAIRAPVQAMLDGSVRFGVGYGAVAALLVLAVAKVVATALSIGSGNAVGTFAPSIFIGAAVGGAVGHLAHTLLPAAEVQPGAFALVGMAAVFAAAARAPLTAILIAFELTGDYGMVLPLMLATGIATFVADRLHPESLYTLPLRQRGILYAEPEDVDIMQTVTVGEVMTRDPDTVPPDLSLPELREEFRRTRHHGFPVVDDGRLLGVVTLADLARAEDQVARGREPLPRFVADFCTREPLTVTPEDPVFRALRRMASLDVGRLPVVHPEDHSRLVGLVRRSDLVKAYQRAVTRSLGVQQRREASRLRDLVGAQFVELAVQPGAPADGEAVRDLPLPERTVLTSVRREGELIMPHGDTVLRAGDEVVALTGRDAADDLRRLLVAPEDAVEPAGGRGAEVDRWPDEPGDPPMR